MATTDKVAELYEHYNQLDNAKEEISKFENSYLAILASVRGSSHEKQLSAQFIAKFFVHFPNHYDAAIDALLDLCEDDDANIRRRAIKELPNICRDRKEFVGKIADVLAQLLLSEDQIELTIVNQALTTLASFDIKSFLQALFGQINEGEEETRDRVVKFLKERLRNINASLWTKEVEEFFLEEAKKVLNDVTKDEFVTIMTLLSGLKISKTLNGHNALLSIIREQAELTTPFNPEDNDFIDKLLLCIRHGIPYFSQFSPSTDFVMYICTKVLPKFNLLSAQTTGIDLELLQCLAEIAPFISPTTEGKDLENCQDAVFLQLLNYVPKPPEDLQTNLTSESSNELPSTQFSHVECLLFIFHQLCKFNPNYFNLKDDQLKDLKLRLQYLARGVQSYINKLKKVISSLKPAEAKSAENKIKVIALKATTNINSLIKDFFKIPPSYKTTISLSFKQQTKAVGVHSPLPTPALTSATVAAAAATPADNKEGGDNGQTAPAETGRKRPLITAPEGSSSEQKRERSSVYTPPTGKFSTRGNSSSSFQRFSSQGSGGNFRGNRNGGGGRGGFSRGRSNFGNRRRYSSRY